MADYDSNSGVHSRFHVKACLVAGVGFFTDAYDIFAVNIAATMIGYVYGKGNAGLNPNQDLGLKVATPIGTLVGQLLFGWLADVVGRKKMYGVELMISESESRLSVNSSLSGVQLSSEHLLRRFLARDLLLVSLVFSLCGASSWASVSEAT